MRSLMVVKFLPLPADSGGNQRSLAVLRKLLEHGEVTLCGFDDGRADIDGLRALGAQTLAVPYRRSAPRLAAGLLRTGSGSAARFWDPRLMAAVRAALHGSSFDLMVVEHSQLAPYLVAGESTVRLLNMHNVESSLAASYARTATGLRRLVTQGEALALRRLERRAVRSADLTIVVSERDRRRLHDLGHDGEALVCGNGWTPGKVLEPSPEPVAAFVGLLGWRPNEDAALWLGREVWPRVREIVPSAHLLLVGRQPTAAVEALASSSVTVTGSVPSVRPYLARARVALAPLRAGGGTRLKILEALDAGRPVVATSIGAEGLEDLVGHGLTIADDPDAIARATARLLQDGEAAAEQGTQGHRAVAERHAWDVVLEPFERELQRLRARAGT